MDIKKGCVLLVQSNLKRIVDFAQKCIDGGIPESDVFATVYPEDIPRFLSSKEIDSIIIDSELYNVTSSSILRECSEERNLKIVLVTPNKFKKTIRMIMNKDLRYVYPNISGSDLVKIIDTPDDSDYKKVVHL